MKFGCVNLIFANVKLNYGEIKMKLSNAMRERVAEQIISPFLDQLVDEGLLPPCPVVVTWEADGFQIPIQVTGTQPDHVVEESK